MTFVKYQRGKGQDPRARQRTDLQKMLFSSFFKSLIEEQLVSAAALLHGGARLEPRGTEGAIGARLLGGVRRAGRVKARGPVGLCG